MQMRAAAAVIDAWRMAAPHAAAAEQGRALAQALRSGSRWDPAWFPLLLAIGRDNAKLGELLSAIAKLPPAVESAPWQFDPAVDPRAFDALGFAASSAGIARTQRENREGWWAHARRSRAFILDSVTRARERGLAVVLGAGKAFDLPLNEIASAFERVVLVDIDAAALAETSASVVRDASLRRRIDLRAMDLSGIGARLARGIHEAIGTAADAPSAAASLETLCRSYRLASAPQLLAPGERADFLVSGMVLTQLALQPKLLAKQMFEKRFGAMPGSLEERWGWVWDELDLRMQQDHINALLVDADLAVLTSDVVHHAMRGSDLWSVIGSDTLDARIPSFMEIVERAAWSWARIRPRPPGYDGVRTDVNAVLLRLRCD
jgi:hypothetical protein